MEPPDHRTGTGASRALRAPSRCPALAVAGVVAAGAACGEWLAAWLGSSPVEPGGAALVVLLGLTAAVRFGSARSGRTVVLLIGLLLMAGTRSAQVESSQPRDGPDVSAHAAHPRRASRIRGRSASAWDLGGRREAAAFEARRGTLRAGEIVRLLETVDRPRRAASSHRPLRPRPLPARPRADEVVRLARSTGGAAAAEPPASGPVARLRARGIARARTHPDADTRGLLVALLFGDTTSLEPGVADLFTRTGTRHLLALSGFHVGLLGLLVALPLARLGGALAAFAATLVGARWQPGVAVPTALLTLAFVPMSGSGAPAARAATALSLALLAPVARRRPSGANLLGVALLVEIAHDPCAPMRPGVQLSYLATLALILVAPRAARRALSILPGAGRVAPTWRSGRPRPPLGRAVAEGVVQVVVIGVSTSIVASAATLPVVWTRFGEWSPVGIVATPLATPFLVVLVAGGWLWVATGTLVPDALLGWTTRGLLELLALADRAPSSPLQLPERPILAVAVGATLVLVGLGAVDARRARRARRWAAATFAGLALSFPFGGPHDDGPTACATSLEVHVLDVGNGSSIVVRAPGARTWILDAGSRDRVGVATDGVGPLLRALEVWRIGVALSHDHADHARDLPWIARRWRTERWAGPRPSTRERPGLGPDPLAGAVRLEIRPGRTRLTEPDGPLEILAIRGGELGPNEGSAVFDVRLRRVPSGPQRRVVLCGDAEDHGLARMLGGDGGVPWLDEGPIDALLLPHHGSDARALGRLLDHLRPRAAIVSGTPAPTTAAELARRGLPVHSTAALGGLLWRPAAGIPDPTAGGSGSRWQNRDG